MSPGPQLPAPVRGVSSDLWTANGCDAMLRERYRPSVQLTPRYDSVSFLRIELLQDDPAEPLLRQRRRLGDTLRGFDPSQWSSPSRCAEWSVQDVVTHLVGTNQFWAAS